MSDRFEIRGTGLDGLVLLGRKPLGDRRGFLERMFCRDELAAVFGAAPIAQINRTLTRVRGTVRGMHFQTPPHAEVKMVSCLRGEVFDVAVDLRRGSPTFLRWHGEVLGGDRHATLVIPEGFAHGFQTLTNDCEMLYFHSAPHQPAAEAGLHPADPALGIDWPLEPGGLSARDSGNPRIDESFVGLEI